MFLQIDGHDPVKTTENGTLYKIGRLNVLDVWGTPYDLGKAHGTLLADEIKTGAVPQFGDYDQLAELRGLPDGIRQSTIDRMDRIYASIKQEVPQAFLDELDGIADGAGLDRNVVFRASFRSELGQVMRAGGGVEENADGGSQVGGCTAAVALPPASAIGKLIHGKNQDYEGAGYWDQHPMLLICRPDGAIPHAKATSAGLMKGNMSMNAAGLTIGGHFLFSKAARPKGIAFTTVENRVLREAETLDQAVSIITSGDRAGAYAFVISDAKSGKAVAVESNSDEVVVRDARADGTLTMSNMCNVSDDMKEADFMRIPGIGRNPVARFDRMGALLADKAGDLSPRSIASCLADHEDVTTGTTRPTGNTIAGMMTVTSAIAVPEDLQFYVAEGAVPVSDSVYRGFDLKSAFQGNGLIRLIDPIEDASSFPKDRQAALASYVSAALASSDGDYDKAEQALHEASAKDQTESLYRRLLAQVQLRQGKADDALEAVSSCEALAQNPHEKAECYLLAGQAHDLAGQRDKATEAYQAGLAFSQTIDGKDELQAISPLLLGQILKLIEKPFDAKAAERLKPAFAGV